MYVVKQDSQWKLIARENKIFLIQVRMSDLMQCLTSIPYLGCCQLISIGKMSFISFFVSDCNERVLTWK